MPIFVGNDWAEEHHDVYVMDASGKRLAGERIAEGPDGIRRFHQLMAIHAEQPDHVNVGIETDHGLWVEALAAAGYRVYAINPLAVARYRDTTTACWPVIAPQPRRSRYWPERISR